MKTTKTTLVIGGRGKTGSRVVKRLEARGLPVRIGSRSADLPFRWEDSTTWAPALQGVGVAYVTFQPDLAFPGADAILAAFGETAKGVGVSRLVLLSGRGEPDAAKAEDAVRASGVGLTVVRASFLCQNFDEGHLLHSVREGVLAMPGGDTPEPFIDADDIADVVVAALLDDGYVGQTLEITGPRCLTFREVASELSSAAGRPIAYVPLTDDEFRAGLAQVMPPEEAQFFGQLFPFLLDGHNARTTDTVERVLGKKARDFRDYARAAAGAWR